MISADLKKILRIIEECKNAKKLPWDCKNFMSLYETEKVRRNIIYKLFDSKDADYKPLEPFRIEIENTTGLKP